MEDSETKRRRELADRLGLPSSLGEAIEIVREHNKIAADKKKQKPEEFKAYGGNGWTVKYPRPWG